MSKKDKGNKAPRPEPKAPRLPRPTRQDELAKRIECEWAHQNTVVIASRQRVLQFEAEEVDKAIAALQGALVNMRDRRTVIDATLRGLAAVVARRGC